MSSYSWVLCRTGRLTYRQHVSINSKGVSSPVLSDDVKKQFLSKNLKNCYRENISQERHNSKSRIRFGSPVNMLLRKRGTKNVFSHATLQFVT